MARIRSFREHYGAAILLRKSVVGAWFIVGLAIFVFAGFLAVRGIIDTGAYEPLIRNPMHNGQCSALSSLTLDSRCVKEEPQVELEDH